MSKRSIRKNRHREDKGANRRTWPTCVVTLSSGLRLTSGYVFSDAVVRIGDVEVSHGVV